MSSYEIIKEFTDPYNFSNFTYSKPSKCANGSFSKVNLNNNKIIIETPFLQVKENCNNKNSSKSYYYLNLYLLNNNVDKDYFQFLYDLEEFNLNIVKENSVNWFGVDIPIDKLYKNQIKPWEIDREGNIILKIKVKKGINSNTSFDNIKKGDIISLRMLFDGINFGNKKFKTNWVAESYSAEDYDYNVFTEDTYKSNEELFFSFYKKKKNSIDDIQSEENEITENLNNNIDESTEAKEEIIEEEKLNINNVNSTNIETTENEDNKNLSISDENSLSLENTTNKIEDEKIKEILQNKELIEENEILKNLETLVNDDNVEEKIIDNKEKNLENNKEENKKSEQKKKKKIKKKKKKRLIMANRTRLVKN